MAGADAGALALLPKHHSWDTPQGTGVFAEDYSVLNIFTMITRSFPWYFGGLFS